MPWARSASRAGLPQVGVLDSSRYSSLHPGYSVVFSGIYDSRDQADRAQSDQVQRTFPARLAASQLLASLVDQETGLRGYALTGDQQFLEPYRQGLVDEQAAQRGGSKERTARYGCSSRVANGHTSVQTAAILCACVGSTHCVVCPLNSESAM